MNRQNLLLVVLAVLVAALSYTWFRYSQIPAEPTKEQLNPLTTLEESLSEIKQIKDSKIDTSIFQDRFFKTLTAPAAAIPTEISAGRPNPFTPF